ncbi:MAG: hypothetical protein U0324_18535 [Polyangiales bacterium]
MSDPKEHVAAAPGALGETLARGGYRARVVIDRVDGEALNEDDREVIANTLAAMDDRDRAAEREYPLIGFVGGRHFAHLPAVDRADAAE